MKTVIIGKEGSGKTLLLGRYALKSVNYSSKLIRKYGYSYHRPLITNVQYSDDFIRYAKSKGVKVIQWHNLDELPDFSECSLQIDEIPAYFDSRTFADLPLNVRLWLAQAQKLGVYMYGTAQDWSQVDISFRRLVNKLILVRKLVGSRRPSKTIPGSKIPWVLGLSWNLNPEANATTDELQVSLLQYPKPTLYTKKDALRFDTNARVTLSDPPPLKKVVRVCPEDGYTRVRYF